MTRTSICLSDFLSPLRPIAHFCPLYIQFAPTSPAWSTLMIRLISSFCSAVKLAGLSDVAGLSDGGIEARNFPSEFRDLDGESEGCEGPT